MKKPCFSKGFTLPELLVSLFIFSLTILGAVSLLISAIGVQKRAGAQQELMDQASYLVEYMSRALRQAQKDLTGACLTTVGAGFNYEITQGGQGIKFINRLDQCQEFFLDGQRIKERIAPQESYITSDNLQVATLGFYISGAGQDDNLQPKATFAIELKGKVLQAGFQPVTHIQTTVSQRKIDVPE
jgi:prepilin-type N-terminal cleavage/methylation domain-containing protein